MYPLGRPSDVVWITSIISYVLGSNFFVIIVKKGIILCKLKIFDCAYY